MGVRMSVRNRLFVALAAATTIALPFAARAEDPKPAVSTLNGKLSLEGGATGAGGTSSGVSILNGSVTTPLGHALGFQLDGTAGTAFNSVFGGGTAHLFWRDPAIGLIGPIASIQAGSGVRLGWYGGEAELYAGIFSFGAWAGYHEAVDNTLGMSASGAFYQGRATVYPTPDLALSLGGGAELNHAQGSASIEFQPRFADRHNVSFYVNGAMVDPQAYSVTAGIRIYFGPDKPLIRRHREDDPAAAFTSAASAWEGLAAELQNAASLFPGSSNGPQLPLP